MWMNNAVFRQDLEEILADPAISWQELDGKRILVTGATGLIGSTLISALLYYGKSSQNPPRVLALVRNEEKARRLFAEQLADCGACLEFAVGDVCHLPQIGGAVDYIIHGASQTASKAFLEKPVETIETAITGTKNLLELAKEKKCSSFVYLSSMEVYGTVDAATPLKEEMAGYLNSLSIRSNYPLSKRLCENLCCAYASEYDVPAKICRLAQVFGPGVDIDKDQRIMPYCVRCARDGEDIVLRTKGKSARMLLYTMDAVSAILTILLKGSNATAYNAANENTFSTILQTAQTAAELAGNRIQVRIEENANGQYPPDYRWELDCGRLRSLGWEHFRTVDAILKNTLSAHIRSVQ